jgi:hypothetical protein
MKNTNKLWDNVYQDEPKQSQSALQNKNNMEIQHQHEQARSNSVFSIN